MSPTKHVLPLMIGIALTLAGCGTRVPELQENPWNHGGERLVQAIAQSIHCEIRNAVYAVKQEDKKNEPYNKRLIAAWLDSWGAQVQITLTADEFGSFGPSGSYSPMQIFFLGLGANLSSEATRVDVLNFYYTVAELQEAGPCSPQLIAENANHPMGSLLIQSDLKLREWLFSVVFGNLTGDIPINANMTNQNAKNALSHEITFKIITSGNITPSWKLVHATINSSPPLFMASRTRTHDLLITFGPNVQGQGMTNSLGPNTPAANANLAQQIGIAVRNQMINSNLP
jgi:hypothetical protein